MAIPTNFDTPQAYWNYVTLTLQRHERIAPWNEQYRYLRAYYWNNGLYDVLRRAVEGMGIPSVDTKSLRNPVNRVVEFYAVKLWPGPLPRALPIVTKNKALLPAIEQLWQWSNWGTEKQTFARWFPMLGDAFIKCNVRVKPDKTARVFMQNIDPEQVTDFKVDERGFVNYIRLDIPQNEVKYGTVQHYTRTEIWDKVSWRVYRHQQTLGAPEDKLGAAIEQGTLAAMGIDFVPFVWQPFRSVGDERGANAFIASLDKIDEANRQATRLSSMLFRHNRALWALQANANDPTGRPMPAPRLPGTTVDGDTLELGDDTILRIPGMGSMTALVAPINYADALAVLNAQMDELREDMPELAYYKLRETGTTSGRAARIILDDVHERATEARSMGEAALIRAHQMCFTLGTIYGVWQGLGTYEDGSFAHEFRERAVLPVDEFEEAQTVQVYVGATVPLVSALRRSNWTDEEIDEMVKEQAKERQVQADLAQEALDAAQARFDQEGNGAAQPDDAKVGDEALATGVR